MSLSWYAFLKKRFNLIVQWQDPHDHPFTKNTFNLWNKKSVQNFSVRLSGSHYHCCGNDSHLPWSFAWHTALYHKALCKFAGFPQTAILMWFIGMASNKGSILHQLLGQYKFGTHYWITLSSNHPQSKTASL